MAAVSLWYGGHAVALDASVWAQAKTKFVLADGRVIDPENGGISHSESQGYAMLLAEAAGDRESFDLIWSWTRANLARKDMRLFAWKFEGSVADENNATDGDIFIAWALMRAGTRWGTADYETDAAQIRAAIRTHMVRQVAGRTVLLPGLTGFDDEAGVTLNLSYLVFPALKAFARADGEAGWDLVIRDGLSLLLDARFGRHGLNPDWLRLGNDGYLSPATGWPPRSGFDAVRIPLYLIWGGEGSTDLLAPVKNLWTGVSAQGKGLPGWVDLRNGTFADYTGPQGYSMVHFLTLGNRTFTLATVGQAEGYYSTMLSLLAMVASDERDIYR